MVWVIFSLSYSNSVLSVLLCKNRRTATTKSARNSQITVVQKPKWWWVFVKDSLVLI